MAFFPALSDLPPLHVRVLRASCCVLVAFVAGVIAPRLSAQSSWTPVAGGTIANLWGVCHGDGQFVAVGDAGTILTSPDGSTWTARRSGTTAWLTSVAHGNGEFVAVGDTGLGLRSTDGVTWQRLDFGDHNPGRERLNVVRFVHPCFMIYGEHDVVLSYRFSGHFDSRPRNLDGGWWRGFATGLGRYVIGGERGLSIVEPAFAFQPATGLDRTPVGFRNVSGVLFDGDSFIAVGAGGAIFRSDDGERWARQDAGTGADLHAITTFNNTAVAVGSSGTILSMDETGAWRTRTTPTTELLLGVAASDTIAIAVGGHGTILRAAATPSIPTFVSAPKSVTETAPGVASFVVRARGSAPLSYQWFRDGAPMVDQTRSSLIIAPLNPTDSGSITVTMRNAAGSVTSAPASLIVVPAPPAVVDATFHADTTLDGSPTALLALPDGGVLVANARPGELLRLRADGSLDPLWVRYLGAAGQPPAPLGANVLVRQSDGRILVGGSFLSYHGRPATNLIRLEPNGAIDPTFQPAAAAVARPVVALAVQSDRRILVANGGTTPVRLLENGSVDPSFQPQAMPAATRTNPPVSRDFTILGVTAAADGTIAIVGVANLQVAMHERGMLTSQMRRLRPNGEFDPAFSPVTWSGGFSGMRQLEDGGWLVLQQIYAPGLFDLPQVRVTRLDRTGSLLPQHARPTIPYPLARDISADGRVVYFGVRTPAPVRLTALGGVDSQFTGGIGQPAALAATDDGHVFVAGNFNAYHGVPAQRVARLNAVANDALNAPRILNVTADATTVRYGRQVVVRAAVVGSGPMSYEWTGLNSESSEPIRTISPILVFAFTKEYFGDGLRLTVRNSRGEATSPPIAFTVLPDAPEIVRQPTRVSVPAGRDVTLHLEKNATSGDGEVEWRRNGALLTLPAERWGDPQTLRLTNVTATDAGTYTLTLRNSAGATVTSAPIVLTLDDVARFANLSTRAFVGAGEQTLIAGFTVSGFMPRRILVRGIGPGLAKFSGAGFLGDPKIQLYRSDGQPRFGAFSEDWHESSKPAFAAVGAFPLDEGSADAAFSTMLEPGSYTVHVTGNPAQSGTALVEIYEYDNEAERMINLSTRAAVRPGSPVIAGVSVTGRVPKKILVRAAGPSLAVFGVVDALANPRLELRDAAGALVAANDDWDSGNDRAALASATAAVGAFGFTNLRDAALLVTLAPGNYTAVIEGVGGTSGVTLAEIYEVP